MAKDLVCVFEGKNMEADVIAALLEAEGLHPLVQGREDLRPYPYLGSTKVNVLAEEEGAETFAYEPPPFFSKPSHFVAD